jgi:hypothetical protein
MNWKFLRLLWRQWRCRHQWHPAIFYMRDSAKHLGARECDRCGRIDLLEDARFYAEFGATINHVLAAREAKS